MSIVLTNFVRAEALFEDFDSLILAIQSDIQATLDNYKPEKVADLIKQ
jgi:FAD synthase